MIRWASTTAPLVAATDASWKDRAGGIGYVVTDGRWGLRGRRHSTADPTGPSRVLVNELRAVEFVLSACPEPPAGLTVLLDSTRALDYLRRWQAGETAAMPAGYSLRARRWSDKPSLVRLADLVAHRRDLSFGYVRGTPVTCSTRPPTRSPGWPAAGCGSRSTSLPGPPTWWTHSSATGTGPE